MCGGVEVSRTVRSITARPFTAMEIRRIFNAPGKSRAEVSSFGECPAEWKFPEKPQPHTAAFLMWSAVFRAENDMKYSFALTGTEVCAAVFVDGVPAAAWMEKFGSVHLTEGVHSLQLFVVQRPSEKLPGVMVFKEGHSVSPDFEKMPPAKAADSILIVQTGASLSRMKDGSIVPGGVSDGLRFVQPGRRTDTRARIGYLDNVWRTGKKLEVGLEFDYPSRAAAFFKEISLKIRYERNDGLLLHEEGMQVSGRAPRIMLAPSDGTRRVAMKFTVAGQDVFNELSFKIIDASGSVVPRASGKSVFAGEDRAVLAVALDGKLKLPSGNGPVFIMDALGDRAALDCAVRKYPDAEVISVVAVPGTLPELLVPEMLPRKAGKIIFLGEYSPRMLEFLCRRAVAMGAVPVPATLPGDRLKALRVMEMGYWLGVNVLDLRAEMM